jgi:DNA-binding transcriptional LysR family regulator
MNDIHSKMDLNLLRVFHTVHTERSVSLAAERLGLTQSAVSHGLRKLRFIFKDELFVRSGQAMIPTSRGQALFEPVQRIMETLQNEVMPVAVFDGMSARREFSLAMVDMAEVVFIPPLMRFLRVNAPHCTLRTLRLPNEATMRLSGATSN